MNSIEHLESSGLRVLRIWRKQVTVAREEMLFVRADDELMDL